MSANNEIGLRADGLHNGDFDRLRSLIYEQAGINLGPEKRTMLEIRLRRRLRALNLSSYRQYCDQLFRSDKPDDELIHLIDVVTTNKTDFFREPGHFQFMVAAALPDLLAHNGADHTLLVWSAGCSTGEEPYTIAMVLSDYAESHPFRFRVLATDISTAVLEKARDGVFKSELLRPVAPDLRRKYFMRSRDRASDLVRVVPELRDAVDFRRLNFMDPAFDLPQRPDMIFCRNVIIYFDRPTQVRLLTKLIAKLTPGGYFFSGHSESLQGMDLPLVAVAPSTYRKPK